MVGFIFDMFKPVFECIRSKGWVHIFRLPRSMVSLFARTIFQYTCNVGKLLFLHKYVYSCLKPIFKLMK